MTSKTVAMNLKLTKHLSSPTNLSHNYHLCIQFFFVFIFLTPGAFTSVSAKHQTTVGKYIKLEEGQTGRL